jgi:hypothetical protein
MTFVNAAVKTTTTKFYATSAGLDPSLSSKQPGRNVVGNLTAIETRDRRGKKMRSLVGFIPLEFCERNSDRKKSVEAGGSLSRNHPIWRSLDPLPVSPFSFLALAKGEEKCKVLTE